MPTMPEWGDHGEGEVSEVESDVEDVVVKGDHFKGFSFFNDCYDFKDDLSNI